MDIWDRQSEEQQERYLAFKEYLHMKPKRVVSIIAEKFDITDDTVYKWKGENNWAARCEAYDVYMSEQEKKRRTKYLDESSFRLVEDLITQAKRLLITSSILTKKLGEGGLKELEGKDLMELMPIANNDLELALKTMRMFKEIVPITPEGRELLEQDAKGTQIVINVNPVIPKEDNVTVEVKAEEVKTIENGD